MLLGVDPPPPPLTLRMLPRNRKPAPPPLAWSMLRIQEEQLKVNKRTKDKLEELMASIPPPPPESNNLGLKLVIVFLAISFGFSLATTTYGCACTCSSFNVLYSWKHWNCLFHIRQDYIYPYAWLLMLWCFVCAMLYYIVMAYVVFWCSPNLDCACFSRKLTREIVVRPCLSYIILLV